MRRYCETSSNLNIPYAISLQFRQLALTSFRSDTSSRSAEDTVPVTQVHANLYARQGRVTDKTSARRTFFDRR